MKALWLPLGAAVMFAQPAAAAHFTKQTKPNQPAQQDIINNQNPPSQPSQSLAQQMRNNLQQSGFSAVRVMPESFLIRARDPQGNPVEMIIRPDSFAAVDVRRGNGDLTTGRSFAGAPAKFAQGPVQDTMSSNLAGTPVQSSDAQDVGNIKGIAVGNDGSLFYLLTLKGGGDVAVEPAAMSMRFNEASDKWNATVDATKQQVTSTPRIQYTQK